MTMTRQALLLAAVVGSAVRLGAVAARHRRRSARGVAVLGLVWTLCAALSLQLAPAGPIASASTPEQLPALLAGTALELSAQDVAALDEASAPFA